MASAPASERDAIGGLTEAQIADVFAVAMSGRHVPAEALTAQQRAAIILARRIARQSFRWFIAYVSADDPEPYQFAPFHERIIGELQAVYERREKRLLLAAPPRHGKSKLCAILFPCFVLGDRPGAYTFGVQTDQGGSPLEFQVDVPEAESFEQDLVMPRGAISGRVFGPDGDPQPYAELHLSRDDSGFSLSLDTEGRSADADGRYTVSHLRPGTYTVRGGGGSRFGNEEGDPLGVEIVTGVRVEEDRTVEGVDLHLRSSGSIEGTVLDRSEKPVGGVAIFVRDERGLLLSSVSSVSSEANGHFSYKGVPPGRFTVSARVLRGFRRAGRRREQGRRERDRGPRRRSDHAQRHGRGREGRLDARHDPGARRARPRGCRDVLAVGHGIAPHGGHRLEEDARRPARSRQVRGARDGQGRPDELQARDSLWQGGAQPAHQDPRMTGARRPPTGR